MMFFIGFYMLLFCFLGCLLEPDNVAFCGCFGLCFRSKLVRGCRMTVLM
jgi:hypothetical protein